MGQDALVYLVNPFERLIPVTFQGSRDQSIFRLDRSKLTKDSLSFILGAFSLEVQVFQHQVVLRGNLAHSLEMNIQACRLKGSEKNF